MEKYHIYAFEKLHVYQIALSLSIEIRTLVKSFPKEEQFDLTRQIKRATDSISSNLAEGSGRSSNLDQAHFTNMAYASGLEVINHLNLSFQLNYIAEDDYGKLRFCIDEILNNLNGLYKYQINQKRNSKVIRSTHNQFNISL